MFHIWYQINHKVLVISVPNYTLKPFASFHPCSISLLRVCITFYWTQIDDQSDLSKSILLNMVFLSKTLNWLSISFRIKTKYLKMRYDPFIILSVFNFTTFHFVFLHSFKIYYICECCFNSSYRHWVPTMF